MPRHRRKHRKTDTDYILIWILSYIAGEKVRDEEDFILKTFIETESDLKEAWRDVRDYLEQIIAKSKDNLTLESRREILERVKAIFDTYIEWERLPDRFHDINWKMYNQILPEILGTPKSTPRRVKEKRSSLRYTYPSVERYTFTIEELIGEFLRWALET
jgi:SpoVK/Ycf46/Vps4 family AAA+-type ATPase